MRTGLLALAFLFLPVTAIAQDDPQRNGGSDKPFYGGLSAMKWNYTRDGGLDWSGAAAQLTLGKEILDFLSAEARYARGGSDNNIAGRTASGQVIAFKLKPRDVTSLFIKPHTRGDAWRVYGLLGGTQANFENPAGINTQKDVARGVSFGAGAEYQVVDSAWLTGEYVNYIRDDESFGATVDYTFDAFSVGLRLEF